MINRRQFGVMVGGSAAISVMSSIAFLRRGPVNALTYHDQPIQKIVAVGHRGAGKFAPENTNASHETALALGAGGIEVDVRFTKDGHAVVMHDAMVDRTTDGHGRVKDMNLREIKALDAGSWKKPRYAGERVPTLREVLQNLKGRAIIDIDFKGGPENAGELLLQLLDDEGFRDGQLVTIFARPRHLKQLEILAPFYALRPHFQSAAKTQALLHTLNIKTMGLRWRSFSIANASAIRENNLNLFTNIMGRADGPVGVEASIKVGARFIQTDNLDVVVPYLRERFLLESCLLDANFQCSNFHDVNKVRRAPA
jgi:glycerophosphoryl diester phosphodiesterase